MSAANPKAVSDAISAANALEAHRLATIIGRAGKLATLIERGDTYKADRMRLALAWALDAYTEDALSELVENLEHHIGFAQCHCRGCQTERTEHDLDYAEERERLERWADEPARRAA